MKSCGKPGNAKRDGIRIGKREAGSQDAGEIRGAEGEKYIAFQIKQRPESRTGATRKALEEHGQQ